VKLAGFAPAKVRLRVLATAAGRRRGAHHGRCGRHSASSGSLHPRGAPLPLAPTLGEAGCHGRHGRRDDHGEALMRARSIFLGAGVTVLHQGRLHLRIEPRADGSPWLADVASLARSLAEAEQRLAAY
jgi:hypothetical protein